MRLRRNSYVIPVFLSVFVQLSLFISCKQGQSSEEKHPYTNALIEETSPYLLQHAHNPVDWKPWSQEALKEAKEEDKLVLVSIGYSSCHWCHVMEEETFVDEEVAEVMNTNFINIKVDREERPDVDQVYMTAVQLMTGEGGWPLNVILLPNGKPLYGGTYHSKEQWTKVLTNISSLYKEDPATAHEYADKVASGVKAVNIIEPPTVEANFTTAQLEQAVGLWQLKWDEAWGGNQEAQKFMMPGNLLFLLDYAQLSGNQSANAHIKTTLDKMALGGVYDQLGGGFYRYSTDPYWKVPHFEKMLYDNAQLLSLYSKAFATFRDPMYASVVDETVVFLDREMYNGSGGYFAALDADSEGEEGKFYIWKEAELRSALGEDYALFSEYYNISEESAWEADKFVLHRTLRDEDFIAQHSFSSADLELMKRSWKTSLLELRDRRVRPGVDDKIITSWNALLIEGFADAYLYLGKPEFLERAERIFGFLIENCYQDGDVLHSFKKGSKKSPGFLEDYTFLAKASLKLYQATMNTDYLNYARDFAQAANSRFKEENSALFRYNETGEDLISRIIKTDDGPIPSPNAVLAEVFLQLGHINYDTELIKQSEAMLNTLLPRVTQSVDNYGRWGNLLVNNAFPYYEIAIVGPQAEEKLKELQNNGLANALIVGSDTKSELALFENRFVPGDTYIYVCRNNSCKLPVRSAEDALNQIRNSKAAPKIPM
ncbi:thioredoxin domain-containing protein [Poritiphilus flavus]|uniref:DUF255 domain-containing protein n=1 Tax=Poritiphilus flavus TaxID=2697053 RepID=A0A6L9ECA4_9FLAO|nr:thioredoxin domain-containing protein [Poritiphilus flavus]NAS12317.1 DUF255 domain-containing protein [Poritiphilus flavus]